MWSLRSLAPARQAPSARAAATVPSFDPWSAVDRRVVDEAPWIPLFNIRSTDLASRRLGNYTYNPQLGLLIDQAWIR